MTDKESAASAGNRFWIIPLALCILAVPGCKHKNTYAPPPPPEVTVSKAVKQDVTDYVEYTGTSSPYESIDIRARVEGFLEKKHFEDSALVKKGALLFTIDPRPLQAKLDEAKANLLVKQAERKVAEATLKRKSNAYKSRAVSEVEVIEATANLEKAKAAVKGAEAAIEIAEQNLSYTRITAPISGRVNRSLVDIGNLVGAGGDKTLLTTIVNDDPAYVYFNVNERHLLRFMKEDRKHRESGKVRPDPENPAEYRKKTYPIFMGLANEDGYPHEGYMDYIENRLDPETGTIQIRAVFPNKTRHIIAGLFVRVRIPVAESKNALLVSERALASDQTGRYLLTVSSENIVEKKPVETGTEVNGMVVIKKGITAEDRVITKGLQRARPGMPVSPVSEESEKKTAEKTGGEA